MGRRWRRPLCRPRLHRGIIVRVEYHGELLLSLDSDVLFAMTKLAGPPPFSLLEPGPGQDWPEIIIKPVMLPG